MGQSSPSRFATFELIRILLPGFYFMSLVFIFVYCFEIRFLFIENSFIALLLFAVGSITSGLSFYSKENPRKRKAFQSNQPSIFILERSRKIASQSPLSEEEARRLYFYIMNHEMNTTVHDKIFFFGMIYQNMINIRRTSFWFGLIGLAGVIIHTVMNGNLTPLSIIPVTFASFVYLMNVRYDKADKKMQENYADQLFWLEMHIDTLDSIILKRTQQQADSRP